MGSFGWALNQYARGPYKRGKFGHRGTQREDDGNRYRDKVSTSQGKRPGAESPLTALKTNHYDTLILDL